MKKIDVKSRSDRSLFIDRLSEFIKNNSEIETVADLLIQNWELLELKTRMSYVDSSSFFRNKSFDSFCFQLKERFKNRSKVEEVKSTETTNKFEFPNKRKKLSKLLDFNLFSHRGMQKGMQDIQRGMQDMQRQLTGMKAQFPNLNDQFKSRLIESLKSELDNNSISFNFSLFYSDSKLKMTPNEDSCPFGLIKIKVLFAFKLGEESTYSNWEIEDFRLHLVKSIRDAMSLKLQELMSEQWSVNNLLDHNCNSLFVTDESFLEFFQNEKGSKSKKVIDYLNGEERNRILNLFQEFLKS